MNVESNEPLFRLIDACCEAYDNPAFKPRNGMTFCNQAVQFISERMGYAKFKSMMANQMVASMKSSGDWIQVSFEEAQNHANQGHLVIAGWQEQPHGHVTVIRPGLPGYSAKWQAAAPKVVNIGAENFIAKPLNWAFRNKPDIYLWKDQVSLS